MATVTSGIRHRPAPPASGLALKQRIPTLIDWNSFKTVSKLFRFSFISIVRTVLTNFRRVWRAALSSNKTRFLSMRRARAWPADFGQREIAPMHSIGRQHQSERPLVSRCPPGANAVSPGSSKSRRSLCAHTLPAAAPRVACPTCDPCTTRVLQKHSQRSLSR